MSQNIEGKVAMITGALGGIGKECVKALLRNKIKGIALLDLNTVPAEAFVNELENIVGSKKTIFIPTDVCSTEQLKAAFVKTISHFGHVDILVNNAGIGTEDGFEKCMDVNVMGVMRSMHLAFEDYLPKHKCGKDAYIVNMSSVMGLTPNGIVATYSVSKYALVGMSMTYGSKLYYDRYGVKVLTICPGYTDTPIVHNFTNSKFPQGKRDNSLDDVSAKGLQRPDSVAEALITALNDGENGSVWLSQDDLIAEKINMEEVLASLRQKTLVY